MKDMLDRHFETIFEMTVLVIIFIVGALLLAKYPDNENLANWITGGVIIGTLARAFGTNNNGKKE